MSGVTTLVRVMCCGAVLFLSGMRADERWDETVRIANIRRVNGVLVKQLPLYTCLETISRNEGTAGKHSRKRDIVQVDVGVGAGQEMYSWPGAAVFSAKDLPALVGHGMLSTGLFHSFVQNLFVYRHGTVRSAGEEVVRGRKALRFTYSVPSLENEWTIHWLGATGGVQQAGEFWVDAADDHLLRLAATATDIPPALPLKTVRVAIDYESVILKDTPALLPSSAQVTIVDAAGKRYADGVAFSNCHVFQTESKMVTSTEDLQTSLARYEAHRGILPAGLTLELDLETAIDLEKAKVGDAITARLKRSLRISKTVEVPGNAIVKGRLRALERGSDGTDAFTVGLEFDELDWGSESYSFVAEMIGRQPLEGVKTELNQTRSWSVGTITGTLSSERKETITAVRIPGAETFFLDGIRELPRGFRMTWRTMGFQAP